MLLVDLFIQEVGAGGRIGVQAQIPYRGTVTSYISTFPLNFGQ